MQHLCWEMTSYFFNQNDVQHVEKAAIHNTCERFEAFVLFLFINKNNDEGQNLLNQSEFSHL